jgi:hypothetical protein
MPKKALGFVLGCLFFAACSADRNVSRSFYFWDSDFRLSSNEENLLNKLRNERIYLKVFTLEWDRALRKPVFSDKVNAQADLLPKFLEIVPVVHIRQDFFQYVKPSSIGSFAENVRVQLDSISQAAGFSFTELQFDFKWNEQSRELYFAFLTSTKGTLDPMHQQLSCSIRLQQLQFPEITGVPPVDRAMLHYYNTGQMNEPGTRNSIYDPDVAARYVSYVKTYRLPLDIALPVFARGVHQRNGEVLSVIQNITLEEVRNSNLFTEKAKGLFAPIKTCDFKGSWFKEGDRLRVEEITPRRSLRAARQVKPFLPATVANVALFYLDSLNTSRYGKEAFEELYSVFE